MPSSPSGFGVNGTKVHDGAVWVSQSEKGLLLRIPVRYDGSPGAIQTKAQVTGIDDFTFGRGNKVYVANAAYFTQKDPNLLVARR